MLASSLPSRTPSSRLARSLAAITRSSPSTTTTSSGLASTSIRPRSAASRSEPSSSRVGRRNGESILAASMAKVLIVEDDHVIAEAMSRHLHSSGLDAVVVGNGDSGLRRLRYERPDACVVDLMLPELDGWHLIETARAEGIGTPIVVVSARGTEHDRVHAL